jgi:2OG-Fe(II) oxygenase superfamily
MGTMVLYCTVPEEGGHTNFRNAGVHVKPERGNGIFFSYIDPLTKVMDTGFTEHSGCPVFVGSKKIVTQWIRLGVDHDSPWDSFNTLGVKKSDLAEYGTEEDSSAEQPAEQGEPEGEDDVDVNGDEDEAYEGDDEEEGDFDDEAGDEL